MIASQRRREEEGVEKKGERGGKIGRKGRGREGGRDLYIIN